MAYVYQHTRLDTNEIFYIGIGKSKHRANSKNRRNKYWHNIVNKYGYSTEIIYNNLCWDSAIGFEKFLIWLYGRKDTCMGALCNMTDGGEGSIGRKHTQEAKDKISKANLGNVGPNKGKKLSKLVCKRISDAKLGVPCLKNQKAIIDLNTNIIYPSINEVLQIFPKYKKSTLYSYLNSYRKNMTSFRYTE